METILYILVNKENNKFQNWDYFIGKPIDVDSIQLAKWYSFEELRFAIVSIRMNKKLFKQDLNNYKIAKFKIELVSETDCELINNKLDKEA